MTLNIGIDPTDQVKITQGLRTILADTMALYARTQLVHWNITGPLFQSVHAMTELQYTELATAVDDLAERLRALNVKVPATIANLHSDGIPAVNEDDTAEQMVAALVKAHEMASVLLRNNINIAAEANDEVTAGLLTDRLTSHEKTAWMLRALLK